VDHAVTVIGKIRARRSGNEGFRQLETIWNAGFDAQSADGISVPEPVGVISKFKMWCQRKVSGETAARILAGPDGVALARRIAEAIHKLHRANLPTERAHTMADELRILRECFDKVVAQRREWTERLAKLMVACEKLGASVPLPDACGIHRDFYSSQVIVDGARLWLIDFDCFCLGDPGLDVGNFLGHVIEQALRERGDAYALRAIERAMEDRFVELSGERTRTAVRVYTTLTLGRHVYLSTQFAERVQTTEALLELCEWRVAGE
jgi:thiamine kinase-like enzyme